MLKLSRVRISGLFSHLQHDVTFQLQQPTLLTGPNGTGKTHVLMLIRAALHFDALQLLDLPYEELTLDFSDGLGMRIERIVEEPEGRIQVAAMWQGKPLRKPSVFPGSQIQIEQQSAPDRFRRMPSGRWMDRSSGRTYSEEEVRDVFGFGGSRPPRYYLQEQPELLAVTEILHPILIDTKRLDREALDPRVGESRSAVGRSDRPGNGIAQYVNDIRLQVAEARRASVQATQSADLSFAARALEASSLRVKEQQLHERYDAVVAQYEELSKNGLATGEAILGFPPKTTPTVRRILSVFLDDWEKRLAPLLPVNEKLRTLRAILDTKLELSGKRTYMDERGMLRFRAYGGRSIRVSRLSSGEQHLVALFTRLTFSTSPGSIVLIDEPEISMHAAWKHAFLDDMAAVAELAEFQVIAATHSTSIIRGRWDLVRELNFSSLHLPDSDDGEVDEQLYEIEDEE